MILGVRRSVWVAAAIAIAAVVVLLVIAGSGIPKGSDLALATTVGLAVGALYAMSASGLVVVYSTTGVFNFAQGAVGVAGAFVYWELHENSDGLQLHPLLALGLVVVVLAPAMGVALDVVLMRRLRTASLVIQLMVTVGLMVFLLTIVGRVWQADRARSVDHFFGATNGFKLGSTNVLWHRFMVVVIAAGIAVGLRLVLYNTRLGVAMRAVVDNRALADLNGARANTVSAFAWALGCGLAALAGILIAPEIEFNPQNLNNIIFVALAAAAFGQLRSLPLTVVGALLIGLLERHTDLWLDLGTDFPFANRAAAPIVLFIVLLALPQSRLAVGRASHNLKPHERLTKGWEGLLGSVALVAAVVVFANGWLNFGIWDPGAWDSIGLNNGVAALSLALIALSLVPLTGWTGQVNFAPLAFAGVGAVVFHKLSGGGGNLAWLPLVGLATGLLGALVALPAARLRGLYLALMSMAFVQLMALVVFPHSNVVGTALGFEPLSIGGWVFDERKELLTVIAVALAIGIFALVLLRRSRWGRRWVALNDSQAASATLGIDVRGTKVIVYGLSAAIAGMAGAFWATGAGSIDTRNFELFAVFELVLLMAAAGMSMPAAVLFLSFRFVFGALAARLAGVAGMGWLTWILDEILVPFGPGLLAIGMVVNQRGAIYETGRGFAPLLPWRRDAREELAQERAANRDEEIGYLGLELDFSPDAVIALDRKLGIQDEVLPVHGYRDLRPASDLADGTSSTNGQSEVTVDV